MDANKITERGVLPWRDQAQRYSSDVPIRYFKPLLLRRLLRLVSLRSTQPRSVHRDRAFGVARCKIENRVKFVLGINVKSRFHGNNMSQFRKQERIRSLILAVVSIGLTLTARAQDDWDLGWPFYEPVRQTQNFGISPFYGYRFGGEVQNIDTGKTYSFADSPAYGLFLDYAPTDYYGRYEVLWSHEDTDLNFHGDNGLGKVDVSIDVIQVGGVLEFGNPHLRGYVSAHIGATHFSLEDSGDTRFSWGVGGGGKAFLTKNFYLRADIRGFCTVTEAEGAFFFHDGVTVASFTGSTLWQGQATAGFGVMF